MGWPDKRFLKRRFLRRSADENKGDHGPISPMQCISVAQKTSPFIPLAYVIAFFNTKWMTTKCMMKSFKNTFFLKFILEISLKAK